MSHPMSDHDGNLRWDPSGLGCVDGGDWDAQFPAAKGDMRSPAFCIPQPCAGLMGAEELAREVYGRELVEGEYDTYLRRLEETCGELPAATRESETAMDLEELLLASYGFSMVPMPVMYLEEFTPLDAEAPFVPLSVEDGASAPAANVVPRDYAVRLNPASYRSVFGPWKYPGLPSMSRRSTIGGGAIKAPGGIFHAALGGPSRSGPRIGPARAPEQQPIVFVPQSNFGPPPPGGPGSTPFEPVPGGPDLPEDKPDPELPGAPVERQPAPVPLPGSLVLLAAAMIGLRLTRR